MKAYTENPKQTEQWEILKKPKSVEEAPEKAHPPRRPLTSPNFKHHQKEPHLRVIVPVPYRPDRGANGRTGSGLGQGSPQDLRGGEMNAGRTPGRPNRAGGCFGCNRATGGRPGEGLVGCAKSSRSTREGGPKRDHDFSPMLTVPNSDPRGQCNTREQSHWGHYFNDNTRLRLTHWRNTGVTYCANAKRGSETSAEKGGESNR